MGTIATPYAASPSGAPPPLDRGRPLLTGGPFDHLSYMIDFAKAFTSHGLAAAASYPWQWLLDLKPIIYSNVYPTPPAGHAAIRPMASFLAMISPPVIALAIPALAVCAVRALRRTRASRSRAGIEIEVLALAWFTGTWAPFELQSALDSRISYIYYMVLVMPGVYLAVTHLASVLWRRREWWLRGLVAAWGLTVLGAAVVMFPFVAIF